MVKISNTPWDFQVQIFNQKTGEEIRIDQDFGYLGKLQPGYYELKLNVHGHALAQQSVSAFTMNKKPREEAWEINEIVLKDHLKVRNRSDWNVGYEKSFERVVKIFEREKNRLTNWVQYPNNGFRVVTISSDGEINIHTISIFTQDNKFWVSTDRKYNFFASKNSEGEIYFTNPEIQSGNQWLNLRKFLKETINCSVGIELQSNLQEVLVEKVSLKNGEFIVEWFNETYGKGKVQIMDEGKIREASIHYTRAIRPKNEREPKLFIPGKIYCTNSSVRIPESNNTNFAWEVAGIAVLKK